MGMAATILLYSGRPNPSWQVESGQQGRIHALLAHAPQHSGECELPDGLGYSGVILTIRDADGHDEQWQVFGGRAVSASECRIDSDRKLERALLESGRAVIDPTMLCSILDKQP